MLTIYLIPLIIHLILLLYAATNIKLGYNIIYVAIVIAASIPVLNFFAIGAWIHILPNGELKDTKLNRWLFKAYWEERDEELQKRERYAKRKNR